MNAFVHIPDKNGWFCVDYAGMFEHWDCVFLIIQHLRKQVREYCETYRRIQIDRCNDVNFLIERLAIKGLSADDIEILNYPDNSIEARDRTFRTHRALLFSPVLHSNCLYWASKAPEKLIKVNVVKELLAKEHGMFCYPEGPI